MQFSSLKIYNTRTKYHKKFALNKMSDEANMMLETNLQCQSVKDLGHPGIVWCLQICSSADKKQAEETEAKHIFCIHSRCFL